MKKIENIIYKKWAKMLKLWKRNKLDSPLNELLTYDNYMAHGHLFYFKKVKLDSLINHLNILKEYLSDMSYNNLINAYKIYINNKINILNNNFTKLELENLFINVDENYYKNGFEVTKIIMNELSFCLKI